MKPTPFLAVVIVCLLSVGSSLYAAGQAAPLFTDQMVERHGLTRAWFNQVPIDFRQHKLLHAIVEGDTLFAVSDDGKLHAVDAETGKSLWVRTFSPKGMDYLEPTANSRMVAVLNGLELFIFNRKNGKLLFEVRLPAAAATACELSEHYVYIPLLNGRLVAFPLDDQQLETDEETPTVRPAFPADDDAPRPSGPLAVQRNDDDVLANIVRSFEETRQSIMAEPEAPKPEPEVVLRSPLKIPMTLQSFGNVLAQPTLTTQWISYTPTGRPQRHQEILTWITDHGSFFAAGIESLSQEEFKLRYMVDSTAGAYFLDKTRIAQREWDKKNEIVSRPIANQSDPVLYDTDTRPEDIVVPSLVVVGGRSGYVFSIRDRVGEVLWQFAANGPVVERIAIVGKDVYCPVFPTGMHAIDLTNGNEQWFAPGIKRFVAASKKRLYTLDAHANLVILNRETGVPISSLNVRSIDQCLFNVETDRVYFVNESGLIQCLKERRICGDPDCRGKADCPHSAALARPIRHRLSALQYADVMNGQRPPRLYWASGADDEDDEEPTLVPATDDGFDGNDPFGTVRRRTTDDDGFDYDDDEDEETPF